MNLKEWIRPANSPQKSKIEVLLLKIYDLVLFKTSKSSVLKVFFKADGFATTWDTNPLIPFFTTKT